MYTSLDWMGRSEISAQCWSLSHQQPTSGSQVEESTATGRNPHLPQYRRGWQLTPHCLDLVVVIQNTPNARLGHVISILNHVAAILYCDGENRVIHEQIITAVQLTAQSGRRL